MRTRETCAHTRALCVSQYDSVSFFQSLAHSRSLSRSFSLSHTQTHTHDLPHIRVHEYSPPPKGASDRHRYGRTCTQTLLSFTRTRTHTPIQPWFPPLQAVRFQDPPSGVPASVPGGCEPQNPHAWYRVQQREKMNYHTRHEPSRKHTCGCSAVLQSEKNISNFMFLLRVSCAGVLRLDEAVCKFVQLYMCILIIGNK